MASSKTALGLLAGVAVGAIIGILVAPESGSKTRRKILDKGQNYIDDLKDKMDQLYTDATEKYDDFVSEAKNLKDSNQFQQNG